MLLSSFCNWIFFVVEGSISDTAGVSLGFFSNLDLLSTPLLIATIRETFAGGVDSEFGIGDSRFILTVGIFAGGLSFILFCFPSCKRMSGSSCLAGRRGAVIIKQSKAAFTGRAC